MNRRNIALALVTSIALSACATKAPKQLPPDPGSGISSEQTGNGAPTPGSQADFLAQMMGKDTIYFDTDMYNIDEADAAALQAQAQWLMRYPNKRATIEGHCDERGTREYNLALGARRANAVKEFLVSQGVSTGRMETVSYGKERPTCTESSESCWAQNRRGVTVLTGGVNS